MSDPFGSKATRRAAEAGEEANALQRQRDNLASARARRETVRESRAAIAESRQAASSQGVATSSAAQGGEGGLKSQFTSNLSFLDNQNLIQDQTSAALGRQRRFEAKAARAKARLGLATKIGGFALAL